MIARVVLVHTGAAVYRGVASLTERLGAERMERPTVGFLRCRYPPEVSRPLIARGYYPGSTAVARREVMGECRATMLADVRCPVLLLNGQYHQFRQVRSRGDVRVSVRPRGPTGRPRSFGSRGARG